MTTVTYAGTPVSVNDEGFFTDPAQWREDMAPLIARREGISELTERHWQFIKFTRHEFPHEPAKEAAKIAGIPKPSGCV
jgi:sulfur relay (sulfurtransferase) DsrC/TusE family protein